MMWPAETYPVLYHLNSSVPANLEDGITDAFDTYNDVVEYTLYERTWNLSNSNITVGFHNIDGKENTLASAHWSNSSSNIHEIKNATITFDSSEKWTNTTMDNSTVYDIEEIAAHEIGHVSGLAHVNDTSQTMSTHAKLNDTFRKTLGDGDLEGFKILYDNNTVS